MQHAKGVVAEHAKGVQLPPCTASRVVPKVRVRARVRLRLRVRVSHRVARGAEG